MTLDIDRDAWVEYVYTVYRTGDKSRDYLIDFAIKQHNIDAMLSNRDEIVLTWQNKSNKNERSFRNESMATTIEYYTDGDVEQLDADGEREEEEDVEWVAFKQQYFSSALISELPMEAAMSFKSVDLPAPFFPTKAILSLRLMRNDMLLKSAWALNSTLSCSIEIIMYKYQTTKGL